VAPKTIVSKQTTDEGIVLVAQETMGREQTKNPADLDEKSRALETKSTNPLLKEPEQASDEDKILQLRLFRRGTGSEENGWGILLPWSPEYCGLLARR